MNARPLLLGMLLAVSFYVWPMPEAEAAEPYSLTVKVEQTGKTVKVTTTIKQVTGEKSQLLASPKVVMFDGNRAEMTIEQINPDRQADDKKSQTADDKLYSGVRVEFIKPLGKDLLVVVTVVEKGSVIWAESTTASVANKATTKPASQAP